MEQWSNSTKSSGLSWSGRPQGHGLESEFQVRKMLDFFWGGTFCGIGTSKFGAQFFFLAVLGVFHWEILLGKWRSKMGLWAIGQLLSFWDLRSTLMEFWVDFTIKSKPCQGGRSKPVVLVQFIVVGVCWGVFKGGSWEFHKCLANIIQSETDSAVQACRGWENKAGFDLSLSLKPKVCTGTFHIMRLKSWYLLNMIWWTTPQDMPNLIIMFFSDDFQCFVPGTNSAPIRGKVVYEALWLQQLWNGDHHFFIFVPPFSKLTLWR